MLEVSLKWDTHMSTKAEKYRNKETDISNNDSNWWLLEVTYWFTDGFWPNILGILPMPGEKHYFTWDGFKQGSKMANNMLELKIETNIVVFSFCCKSLCWLSESLQALLWLLVMATIQDGWQHDSWSKVVTSTKTRIFELFIVHFNFISHGFNLRQSVANTIEMATMTLPLLIFGHGWHPRWLTKWALIKDDHKMLHPPKLEFQVFPSFLSFQMFSCIWSS